MTEFSISRFPVPSLKDMPEDIRSLLPAAPANLAKQFWMDLAWWTENGARAQERWNRWMRRKWNW